MIRLNCTNCQTELTLDDAFAGGVCRCQHCGTIQTVPSHLRSGVKTSSGASDQTGPKSLYQQKARSERIGSGLDALAEVVASSGLAGSGLQQQMGRPKAPSTPPSVSGPMMLLLGSAGGVIVLLLLIILWLMLGRGTTTPTVDPSTVADAGRGTLASTVQQPVFLDVPLAGNTMVYVLDRGSATADLFSLLLEATFRSIATLGQDRRFQIVFWSDGSDPTAYPTAGTTFATPANIESARRATSEVYAFGQTQPDKALQVALASDPDTLILATGKGWELDESFTGAVLEARGNRKTVIHAFSLGSGNQSDALAQVAQRTGGQYRVVSETALRAARQ